MPDTDLRAPSSSAEIAVREDFPCGGFVEVGPLSFEGRFPCAASAMGASRKVQAFDLAALAAGGVDTLGSPAIRRVAAPEAWAWLEARALAGWIPQPLGRIRSNSL